MRSQELPIFRKFCKPLRNFVTKTFQSCSQRVRMMGICKRFWLFLIYDFATYKIDSSTSQWNVFVKKVWLSWVPLVKFGLFWLPKLKFWLIRNDTFYGIWLLWPSFWQNFLDFAYHPSGPLDNALILPVTVLWTGKNYQWNDNRLRKKLPLGT